MDRGVRRAVTVLCRRSLGLVAVGVVARDEAAWIHSSFEKARMALVLASSGMSASMIAAFKTSGT
jgi:hypothetical protein